MNSPGAPQQPRAARKFSRRLLIHVEYLCLGSISLRPVETYDDQTRLESMGRNSRGLRPHDSLKEGDQSCNYGFVRYQNQSQCITHYSLCIILLYIPCCGPLWRHLPTPCLDLLVPKLRTKDHAPEIHCLLEINGVDMIYIAITTQLFLIRV